MWYRCEKTRRETSDDRRKRLGQFEIPSGFLLNFLDNSNTINYRRTARYHIERSCARQTISLVYIDVIRLPGTSFFQLWFQPGRRLLNVQIEFKSADLLFHKTNATFVPGTIKSVIVSYIAGATTNLERSTAHEIPWRRTAQDGSRRLSGAPLPETWVSAGILCAPPAGRTRTSGGCRRTGKTLRRRAPTRTSLPVRPGPVHIVEQMLSSL